MPSLTATHQAVAKSQIFANEDEEFWWRSTAEPLDRLLTSCQYGEEARLRILKWYHRFILPALGPRPIRGRKAQFEPCLVYDGSACELSVNWKELDPLRTVRFTIEAVGPQAGTSADPFNQNGTQDLLRRMAEEVPGIDLTQFEQLTKEFFLPNTAADSLVPKLPDGTPLSQVWVAFDLLRDQIMAKVYFIPILKWIESDTPTRQLVKNAILKYPTKYGSYETAYAMLESYLDSFEGKNAPHIELIAIDCVDSPNSRLKVYLRTTVNTLAKAKDAYTLGGRLSGEVVEAGLTALHEFWSVIFQLQGGDIENTQVLANGEGCGYAIEMKPGEREPEIKIHCPVRKLNWADEKVATSLASLFQMHGDAVFATAYKCDLARIFPGHDLESGKGTHTFVSFTYSKKTGVYMSMYYSTKIHGVHVKDHWEGFNHAWNQREEIGVI